MKPIIIVAFNLLFSQIAHYVCECLHVCMYSMCVQGVCMYSMCVGVCLRVRACVYVCTVCMELQGVVIIICDQLRGSMPNHS